MLYCDVTLLHSVVTMLIVESQFCTVVSQCSTVVLLGSIVVSQCSTVVSLFSTVVSHCSKVMSHPTPWCHIAPLL